MLIIIRCIQGLSAGGEYTGATIYTVEHSPMNKRNSYAWAMSGATIYTVEHSPMNKRNSYAWAMSGATYFAFALDIRSTVGGPFCSYRLSRRISISLAQSGTRSRQDLIHGQDLIHQGMGLNTKHLSYGIGVKPNRNGMHGARRPTHGRGTAEQVQLIKSAIETGDADFAALAAAWVAECQKRKATLQRKTSFDNVPLKPQRVYEEMNRAAWVAECQKRKATLQRKT
ncbi:glyoxylate carboligase, partial [Alcaligenes faecalis subsp. faecalis NCIB 8687]